MLKRLKRALVESYIGAIALGWLLADDIMQFANIFATPIQEWAARHEYSNLIAKAPAPAASGLPLEFAEPAVVRFLLILAIWYGLVRWLYFDSPSKQASEPVELE